MKYMRLAALLGLMWAACCAPVLLAQGQPVDRILAVVDEEVILYSDVKDQFDYLLGNGQRDDGTLFCRVFEQLLVDKLLLARARLDSLTVSEDQVDGELNRRIELMMRRLGSEEALVEQLGQSVAELRVEQRPMVEEQLLVQQQQNKIYGRIQVTPQMVRDFYAQIPTDSLPYLPAEVEISQIILKPTPSETNKQAARARLAGILADVKAGTITFQDAARRFSQDRGSAEQAGFLGQLTRGDVVPEFAAEVFNLQPNQLSDVFESPFGFHVALLHKREGDIVTVSHILIKPIVDTQDEQRCRERLAQIRTEIEAGRISFEEAARQYSEDRRTKDAGGQMSDQVSGSYRIPIDQLDADLYLKLDQLQEGQVSEPLEVLFQDLQLTRAYQLVYLRKRYQPHRASLESDYEKFYNATKQAQQAQALEDWLQRNRRTIYHQIKAEQCRQALQGWD